MGQFKWAIQDTAEVPPKGAAGAGNRRGRPKKAKAAQERRPGGRRGAQGTQKGAQGHPKGTQGEAKGQSGHLLRPNVYALSVWEAESAKTLGRSNTQADHKGAKGGPGGKGAGHQERPEDPRADRGEPRKGGAAYCLEKSPCGRKQSHIGLLDLAAERLVTSID